jgi:hypothetical protein
MRRDYSRTLRELGSLDGALIDSSSLIYARSLRLLRLLARKIRLETLSSMCAEVVFRLPPEVIIHEHSSSSTSADDEFSAYAERNKCVVISEDKAILMRAWRAGLPHFNMLMLLEFLFLHAMIDEKKYTRLKQKLYSFAWYSLEVKAYGTEIHRRISRQKIKE